MVNGIFAQNILLSNRPNERPNLGTKNENHISRTKREKRYNLFRKIDNIKTYIDGHESKPANSNFSKFFLFDKFEGDTILHNVLKNLVPSMSLYPSFRQLSKPAISHSDTFQRNKTG